MKTLNTILRVLTFFCFFAPFVTCNNIVTRNYSFPALKDSLKTDSAAKTIQQDSSVTQAATVIAKDSVQKDSTQLSQQKASADTLTKQHNRLIYKQSIWEKIWEKANCPTDNSFSGFGLIFWFSNITGEIAVALSFLLSLLLLFNWKFLRKKNWRLYFLVASWLCTIVLIITIFTVTKSETIWGIWTLLGLQTCQLILLYFEQKKPSVNN